MHVYVQYACLTPHYVHANRIEIMLEYKYCDVVHVRLVFSRFSLRRLHDETYHLGNPLHLSEL
jgi:hypothetical protein